MPRSRTKPVPLATRVSNLETTLRELNTKLELDTITLQTLGMKIGALENKESKKEVKHHYPMKSETGAAGIHTVHCLCGEVTKYKVSLLTIDDFVCPKERK
jgi:hypothetical protein